MTPINFPARFPPLLSKLLQNTKKVHVNELRTDWLTGYYALGRDKSRAKTISINNFSSGRIDSEGLYGR